MAITITKQKLSGSVDGGPIGITASHNAAGTLIHLGVTGTNTFDEVYIYATNRYSQSIEIALEWGISNTNSLIVASIPPKDGAFLVTPGILYQGSAAISAINAYLTSQTGVEGGSASGVAGSSPAISIFGYVNRIVQT